ncbi:MAG TPA: DUF2339 domain-containing protein, partial [Steroidobacteraceae bacterium]|nr:DUF2339 domain-containing protein [Steroidobacteraceae bacterium]
LAVGSEVLRWHLISLPLLTNWAFLAAAAFLAVTRLRHRLLPEALFAVVAGVLVTTSWAAAVSPAALSWLSLVVAPLVLVWLSIRRAGADPETRAGRLLAAAIAPIVAGLWALHDGRLADIRDPQFALSAMAATALIIVALSALASERSADWRAAAVRIYATSFAVVLGVATTIAISRSPWAIALEALALAGLALVVWTQRPDAPAPDWVAPACALGLGLALQADLLRWLGPPGNLEIADIAHMRLTGLISLLWAALGALFTVWATRSASRMLWIAGATLMVAAAVKFVLLDFGGLGQLGNILAVIAAGVVFLLVGWLAPMPPAAAAAPPAARGPGAPGPRPPSPPREDFAARASAAPAAAATPAPAAAPAADAGAMNEYWRRNASAGAPAALSARTDSADRTAWIIVILAALVLLLSQCAHTRLRYSDFGGYRTATPVPRSVTVTRTREAAPPDVSAQAPSPAPAAAEDIETAAPAEAAAAAPAAVAPTAAAPAVAAPSDAGPGGGAYACTQPDGSRTYSDTPCSRDAERIALPHDTASRAPDPTIVSGVYVSLRNRQALDITAALRSTCAGGSCSLNCGNLLAGDPDFGQRKYCRITYQCARSPGNRQVQIPEGQSIRIACD